MKMKHLFSLFFFVIGFGLTTNTYAQKKATVEIILEKTVDYVNEYVSVEGFITQYTPADASTTANYLIQGEYGGIMKINTSESQPKILEKYRVVGTVIIDPTTGVPYMVEKSRISLAPPEKPKTEQVIPLWVILLICGLGLLLAVAVVLIFIRKSSANGLKGKSSSDTGKEPPYDNQFKTVKIVTQSGPKTMVYIPGKLEIVNGGDAGKQFMLSALPAPGGAAVITIGNREETGDKKFAHIRLLEKTVSRAQAELIYIDKKLFIKNLSTTNFTQLNGLELQPGESGEVLSGSKIRVGEIVFQYIA
jgi:hypothetical protein